MDRINKIIFDEDYCLYLHKNNVEEKNRVFCKHHFEHLIAVARLTYLLILEEGSPFISREIAYAAGLLHDIGRWNQYQTEADHAKISSNLADPILDKAGFPEAERKLIQKAIAQHRLEDERNQHITPLSKALKKADDLSRLCYCCSARHNCKKLNKQPQRERLIY